MIGETPFLLQVEDIGPDIGPADSRRLVTQAMLDKKFVKVPDTTGNDSDGIGAFPLGGGAEPVTL